MGSEILHGVLHGGRGNGNGYLGEGLLAAYLSEPSAGFRFVPGTSPMSLAAATGLRGDGCGRRDVSSETLSVIFWGRGAARAFTATAGLPGEEGQTEGLDVAIRAAAGEVWSTGDQRHDRRQPDR